MEEERILDKVQKLLDKAWSTTFEEEKRALLAKADALMVKYSLDQMALLDPSRPATATKIKGQEPIMRPVSYCDKDMAYDAVRSSLVSLFGSLVNHLGCRHYDLRYGQAKVVGYPADIDFLEMMYLSLKLDFLSRMDPSVQSSLSWEANLIALKQSGLKWEAIHDRMHEHPQYPYRNQSWARNMGVRFTGVYKNWRDLNPDEPHNTGNPTQWRESFLEGYVLGIRRRLNEMREETVKISDNLPALLDCKMDLVDELFLKLNPPSSSSKPVRYKKQTRMMNMAAHKAGLSAAQRADLNQRGASVGSQHRGELT